MRLRIPRSVVVVSCMLLAAGAANLRQELLHVPRIRVGPLHSDAPAAATMRFFALGDTGTGGEAQLEVAAAMESRCKEHGADAIWLLGDNAYPAGFRSVEDPQWQSRVLEPYGSPCLSKLPIYAVLGRDDYRENPAAEIEFSLINARWRMPNRFYSVSFGKLLKLVAFDSNISDFCFRPAFCGLDFLFESVAQRDTTWTFVIAHHPLASASGHGFAYRGGIRGLLLKPYLCNRIDLWLSAQARHLEARQPDECRMGMYVAGGGGGDLYPTADADTEVRFLKTAYGFLELELSEAQVVSRLIGKDGQVLYEGKKLATPRAGS